MPSEGLQPGRTVEGAGPDAWVTMSGGLQPGREEC